MDQNSIVIIAEAGVNHNGSLDTALKLIDAASTAGADFVKFQTFKTENLVTLETPKAKYQMASAKYGVTQYEMLKSLELTEDDHFELFQRCKKRKIKFLSTPFDLESLLFLHEKLGQKLIKIENNVTIAAGAVVIHNVDHNKKVGGIPAEEWKN